MRRRVAAVLAVGLLVAACSGGSPPPDSSGSVPSPSGSTGALPGEDSTTTTTSADDQSGGGTLFVGLKLGASSEPVGEIALTAIDVSDAAMRLVATVYHDDDWAVSPSGQAVAVATSWQREDRLRLIDTATTAVRWERSMEDWTEFGPVWSHDERSVAVLRGTSSGTDVELPLELLVIGADNGDATLAVETPRSTQGFSTFLEWSADDESILTGIPVRLVRADDGTMVPFPVPAEDGPSVLVWSPDGQHILRWSVDSAELTIWSSDGREETPLGQGLIWSGVWEPWSPDGSHLAFVAFDPSGSTPAEFVVVDANGGSRQTLVKAAGVDSSFDGLPMTWAWSPNGTELAVMESQRIWILPIDGGDSRDLMVLDIDEGSFYGTTLAWRNVAAGGDIVALPTFEQLGTPGSVEAFDAITGTTQWTVGLPGQPLMDIGGLAASGTVVAVAIGRREANQAIAGIDATLGEVIWTSPMENISRIDAGVASILVSTGSDLVSIDAFDGSLSWQIPLAGRWGPAIGEAAVVLAGAIPTVVTAYDPVSGAERWATLLCEQCVPDHLIVAGDLVAVTFTAHEQSGAVSSVAVLDPATGETIWRQQLCDDCFPVGMAATRSGVIVLTNDQLTSLDLDRGSVNWTMDLAGGSRIAATQDLVLFLSEEALVAIDAETGDVMWRQAGGYEVAADDEIAVATAHNQVSSDGTMIEPTVVLAYDVASGSQLWERYVRISPIDLTLSAGIVFYALPAAETPPPDPGPAPLLVVDGWQLVSGSTEEYNFTREDGAMLECWSTPITDIHTLESYLQDRGNESRNDPMQVSIDGQSGWLFSYDTTASEVLWEEADHVMALRSYNLTEDQFRTMLGAVRHVSHEVWEAAHEAVPTPTSIGG